MNTPNQVSIHNIRRKDELVLRIFAFIFSGIIWLLLLGSLIAIKVDNSGTDATSNFPKICYWEDVDVQSGYDYSLFSLAEQYDYEEDCLPEDVIPASVKTTATASFVNQTKDETTTTTIVVLYLVAIILFIYFTNALAMAHIRLNAMRLSKEQFTELYEISEGVARDLGIKKMPKIYLLDADGVANAFAIKITRRKMVVLYAELFERLFDENKYDEIKAILAHELTHVRLKHINYWIFLLPFNLLPLLGSWLSRKQELSADRGALAVCPDLKPLTNSLIKLSLGLRLSKIVNTEEYIKQSREEKGLFAWVAKITSTHPPIPYRIDTLSKLHQEKRPGSN